MDGSPDIETGVPMLAVLPFPLFGGGVEDTLLSQGLHAEICAELTRFRSLRVISPASAAACGDRPDAEIAARLNASHVLRGRLRRAGERLQVTVDLSASAEGTHLWSDRFEGVAGDIFTLQDEIVARLVASLNARLDEVVLAASRRASIGFAPHLLGLRGFRLLRDGTLASDEAARALFREALTLDPGFARAHAGIAYSWFNEWSCQYWNRFEENGRLAYTHAHAALALDDRDALLHQVLGKVHLMRREYERASWYFDRALALCPNDADILIAQSVYSACLGEPEVGIIHAERAMRLHPFHPNAYFGLAAIAHLVAGDAAASDNLFRRSDGLPYVGVPAFHAIALGHLGCATEAAPAFADFLVRYREKIIYGATPVPGEAVRWFFDFYPFRSEEHAEYLRDGFRRIEAPPPDPRPKPRSASTGLLCRTPTGWLAEFSGARANLPSLKGIEDIRLLLGSPSAEVHCLDLAGRDGANAGGAVLDERARSAIKARIRDLQEALAEAENMNDLGRAETLRAEMDRLVDALAAALGLGGRERRLGDLAEKARTAVTWRIRHAVRRIGTAHAPLGRHLANSIRTGTFCRYSPEAPVLWRFETADPHATPAA